MPDSEENLVSNVRISTKLRKALKRYARECEDRTGVEPAFGELLSKAWESYTTVSENAIPPKELSTIPSTQVPVSEESEVGLNGKPEIQYWVELFQRLLESGNSVVIGAITRNVHAFAQLIGAINAGYPVSDYVGEIEKQVRSAADSAADALAGIAEHTGGTSGIKQPHRSRGNTRTG